MGSKQTPQAGKRPSPEALLRQVQAEELDQTRGKLKVFLGYASGVGKSHRMLDEGRRRRERGQDVVVGAIQPVVGPEVQALLNGLEVIPLKSLGGGVSVDVDAILRRHPSLCIIDGLAYQNPPGSRNAHRWQDVRDLLMAGISVLASINLQYIEERRDRVEQITGKKVDSSVPVSFLNEADEIEIVDAPAEVIAGAESSLPADGGPTREQKLQALREIALLLAADVVDQKLEQYLHRQGVNSSWGTLERILVCITPRSDAGPMIESGARNANRFHGELHIVYVRQPELSSTDEQSLDSNLRIAKKEGAQVHVLEGEDPIEAILDFAREHGITQIFIGHSQRDSWKNRWFGDPVDRLIRSAKGIDIQVFPHNHNS
ncbi:MAG: universal stress protein [Bryobacteraceae bacterium]|nr:universal stress protein [Bryobacteraceae bacterium]